MKYGKIESFKSKKTDNPQDLVYITGEGMFQIAWPMLDTTYNATQKVDEYTFSKDNGMLYGAIKDSGGKVTQVSASPAKEINYKGSTPSDEELRDFLSALGPVDVFDVLPTDTLSDLVGKLPKGYSIVFNKK